MERFHDKVPLTKPETVLYFLNFAQTLGSLSRKNCDIRGLVEFRSYEFSDSFGKRFFEQAEFHNNGDFQPSLYNSRGI